jgi:restriction system protein
VDQMVQAARSGRQNIAERQRQQQHPLAPEAPCPSCPLCGKPMVRRTAHKGVQTGSQFWGCIGYPECRGTRRLDESAEPHRSDGRVGSVGSSES